MESVEPADYSSSMLTGTLIAVIIIAVLLFLFLRRSFLGEISHFFSNIFGLFSHLFGWLK